MTIMFFSFKVAPACLELTRNSEGEDILVAIVCSQDEEKNNNEELSVAKCCPHGQQLTGDHRGCRSHNGKGFLPPRWQPPKYSHNHTVWPQLVNLLFE